MKWSKSGECTDIQKGIPGLISTVTLWHCPRWHYRGAMNPICSGVALCQKLFSVLLECRSLQLLKQTCEMLSHL